MKYLRSYKIFESLYGRSDYSNIVELLGQTIHKIFTDNETFITFVCDNKCYRMYGSDDYAYVSIDDINGDLNDLINSTILVAEENTDRSVDENPIPSKYTDDDSYTWTFYKLATIKGYVDIRWFGSSNGYYSETADFTTVGIDSSLNPYSVIWDLFEDEEKLELFDDYDIIQNGEVNVDRLNEFLQDLGKPKVNKIEYTQTEIKIS